MNSHHRMKTLFFFLSLFFVQLVTVSFLEYTSGKVFTFIFLLFVMILFFLIRDRSFYYPPILNVFLLILCSFSLLSWFSFNPFRSLLYCAVLAGLVVFCMLLSHWMFLYPECQERAIDVFLVVGLIAALLGLYEYSYFLQVGPAGSVVIPFFVPADKSWRVGGPYGQPNLFALFLSVNLLAFFYRFTSSISFEKQSFLYYLPPFVVAVVFFLTGSRSGLLSFLLVMIFLLWLVVSGRFLMEGSGKTIFYRLIVCLICAFFLQQLFSWYFSIDTIVDRTFSEIGSSVDARFVLWMSSFLIFYDYPFFGVGLGSFRFVQNAYGPFAKEILGFVPYEAMVSSNSSHNELLQILCEGGGFVFIQILLLLSIFFYVFWINMVVKKNIENSLFLFSHLFIVPFIFQSLLSWPMRFIPLSILFFYFIAILVSQYPMKQIVFKGSSHKLALFVVVVAMFFTIFLFKQELEFSNFKSNFTASSSLENVIDDIEFLSERPYFSYRILAGTMPRLIREAFSQDKEMFSERVLLLLEKLTIMEGTRWQWYCLARLYLKVGREEEARIAVKKAIDLMPSDQLYWLFLHYLNMLEVSRETGKHLDSLWPRGRKIDFSKLDLVYD